jgi:hypothetical protein
MSSGAISMHIHTPAVWGYRDCDLDALSSLRRYGTVGGRRIPHSVRHGCQHLHLTHTRVPLDRGT